MSLTTSQKMTVLELSRAGLSIRAIASATGFSPTTVQKYLADWFTDEDGTLLWQMKQGRDGKRRPSRRFDTYERDSEIARMWRGLKTMSEIAAEVGCSVGTVHRVLTAQRLAARRAIR